MPKAIKKRVTKKLPVREEEVRGIVAHTIDAVKERKKFFILLSSIVGAVIVVSLVVIFYNASVTKKAYSLEQQAGNYYYGRNLKNPLPEEQRWRKALELYDKSLKTKEKPLVQFYIGNCYFKLNDYNNAVKSYKAFIDKYHGEEDILPLVYQKLASSYVNTGSNDDALKTLETLKKFKNGAFKDTGLIEEARLYEAVGRTADAQKRYEELIKEFPNSVWDAEARSRTETLKAPKEKPAPSPQ
ncbi:MAG: tetratricopeptide repeat protein [Nitrospirae bacterium]|nr:tetratricopeptide repeat protein [Nitrospirota bacterium]